MAKSHLLFALAATFLSLAAFSATALMAPNNHNPAAAHFGHLSTNRGAKHKPKHAPKSHTPRVVSPPPEVDGEGKSRPTEPYPGFYASVDRCLEKLSEKCGEKIFKGIFGIDHEVAISKACCVELVAMGRRCHRKILKATMLLPELSDKEKKEIKRRDVEVWSRCASVSNVFKFRNYSPSPSST